MITYKIDKQAHAKVSSQVKDMAVILEAIAPTLQTLQELMSQHEASMSTMTINSYRYELQQMIAGAIRLASAIAANSQKLVSVSDQAAKHLLAIEEHFGAALREKTEQPAQVPVQ